MLKFAFLYFRGRTSFGWSSLVKSYDKAGDKSLTLVPELIKRIISAVLRLKVSFANLCLKTSNLGYYMFDTLF